MTRARCTHLLLAGEKGVEVEERKPAGVRRFLFFETERDVANGERDVEKKKKKKKKKTVSLFHDGYWYWFFFLL